MHKGSKYSQVLWAAVWSVQAAVTADEVQHLDVGAGGVRLLTKGHHLPHQHPKRPGSKACYVNKDLVEGNCAWLILVLQCACKGDIAVRQLKFLHAHLTIDLIHIVKK